MVFSSYFQLFLHHLSLSPPSIPSPFFLVFFCSEVECFPIISSNLGIRTYVHVVAKDGWNCSRYHLMCNDNIVLLTLQHAQSISSYTDAQPCIQTSTGMHTTLKTSRDVRQGRSTAEQGVRNERAISLSSSSGRPWAIRKVNTILIGSNPHRSDKYF